MATHPKTELLKTLPRVATVSLAALIAERGPLLGLGLPSVADDGRVQHALTHS